MKKFYCAKCKKYVGFFSMKSDKTCKKCGSKAIDIKDFFANRYDDLYNPRKETFINVRSFYPLAKPVHTKLNIDNELLIGGGLDKDSVKKIVDQVLKDTSEQLIDYVEVTDEGVDLRFNSHSYKFTLTPISIEEKYSLSNFATKILEVKE